jgi:hypothetical protein
MTRSTARRLLLVGLFGTLAGLVTAVTPLSNLTLEWRPTTKISKKEKPDVSALARAAVRVDKLLDKRHVPNPEMIGENREKEDKGEVLAVLTKDDVAAFCTTSLADTLKSLGVPIATGQPTVVISGELTSFFATEKDGYLGDVSFRIKVANAAGQTLWSGVAKGAAKHGGRSYNAGNYCEVYSDSLMEAIVSLVHDQGFMGALAGTPAAR